jgi:hypothetical protein
MGKPARKDRSKSSPPAIKQLSLKLCFIARLVQEIALAGFSSIMIANSLVPMTGLSIALVLHSTGWWLVTLTCTPTCFGATFWAYAFRKQLAGWRKV